MKDWALLKAETAIFWPVDLCAGDIAGQEVWGELNTMKIAFNYFGQGLDRASLGQSRRAFNQNMTTAQQCD